MPSPQAAHATVQRAFDKDLALILEKAAFDIESRILRLKRGPGGDIRAAQLRLVLNEIRNIQQIMWNKGILTTVVNGRRAAAKAAEEAIETLERVLYTALPESVAQAVRDGLRATALAGIERDHARVPRALSSRVYRDFALTSGRVEDLIRTGIISGLSARELAATVRQYISPTVPGGASYAAMRLARTEINNSFHQQQIKGGQRPGVKAVIWNLSGSHRIPDLCNQYAAQNVDGLGRGKYKPESVPGKPHPQCLCFLTYDTLSPDEFAKAIKRGDFDDELDRRIKANLDRLGPTKKATPRKATKATTPKVTPIKKATPVKKATPTKKATTPRAAKKTTPKAAPTKLAPVIPIRPTPAPVTPRSTVKHPLLDKTPKLKDRGLIGRSADLEFDILNVNPKYRVQPNYDINCVHVVNAMELRARGFQVTASALPDHLVPNNGRNAQEALNRWVLPDGSNHGRSIHHLVTKTEIEAEANSWPDGARGWVRVSWRNGGGHIFNVEKLNGRVRYVDGQSAKLKINDLHYRRYADPDSWSIVRVDDLEPKDSVIEFIDSAVR